MLQLSLKGQDHTAEGCNGVGGERRDFEGRGNRVPKDPRFGKHKLTR